MIKPLSVDQIRDNYQLDGAGYIKLSMNAMLIKEENQVILMDPGCADFLPPRLVKEYGLLASNPIEKQLTALGYGLEQVTDVIFTHLHFDHGSGAFIRIPGKIVKRFPQARYHVLKEHFMYARRPDPKESNSFFTSFFKHVDSIFWLEDWENDRIRFRIFQGHTKQMVVPVIKTTGPDIFYVTDLIPMESFLKPGVHSGYDLEPELANQEKLDFLDGLNSPAKLIFFHDSLKNSMFYP
jgi:glyoxylase-like metal-dependent hydrolase (beta-lactamase superfamily II)